MPGIFLSYRRDDSQGEALHLFDDLKEHFGQDRVFMDVTAIDPGLDFRKTIDAAVGGCDVLIVMIGKDWLDAAGETGKRRLDDPGDFVRMETAVALRRDIPTIPVLVQGAAIPRSEQLPKEIASLAWRNGFEVRLARWDSDVAELVKALKKAVKDPGAAGEAEKPPRLPTRPSTIALAVATGAAALIGILTYAWMQTREPDPSRATMSELEYDNDRSGGDYRNFTSGDPRTCQEACAKEAQCVAFTFAKPGVQGPAGWCWLKTLANPPRPTPCCISGFKKS